MKNIFSKKIIKYGLITFGVIILLLLIWAYFTTISTYSKDTNFDSPHHYGNFICGKLNWHGHTWHCTFAESYKESLGEILIVLILILFIPVAVIGRYPIVIVPILILILLIWKRKIIKATIKNWNI